MRKIPFSELIINDDGSVFHLHIRPEQIADTVILVGDPNRVTLVASHFDTIECEVSSREFHTITGTYKGKRLSCVSHGIGTDNIDIVVTELDALVNVDFATRQEKERKKQLTLVRIGTSGGLQTVCPIGTYVVSKYSIGFDGLLNFYDVPDGLLDYDIEKTFCAHTSWSERLAAPYVARADEELVSRIGYDMVKGITISAPGFYAPQGRCVRAPLAFPALNEKIISFRYGEEMITNFEMESSALAGLGGLLGHKAMTVCAIIAGRVSQNMNTNYHGSVEGLIKIVLDRL
jgi:uridine phosphorylase